MIKSDLGTGGSRSTVNEKLREVSDDDEYRARQEAVFYLMTFDTRVGEYRKIV